MKIANIHITHFLGAAAVDVRTHAAVQLFCGPNGAGKSSVRDAVALALTADLGRVTLKKEASALIRDGADLAVVEVTDADGDVYGVSINRSGKIHDSRSGRSNPADPVLPYVLDAQRFARLDLTERRAFLFGLMNLKTDGPAIVARLLKRELDAKRVERITPLLRSGFAEAHKEARAKATEAKGAWRATTGEAYGSEKGKTWRAHVPAYDANAAAALATELKHNDVAAEQWQRQIGALQAEESRRATLRAKLPALQEAAAKAGRIEAKLAADEAGLAEAAETLSKATEAAGAGPGKARVGLVHDLARALHDLVGDFFPDNIEDHETQSVRIAGATLQAYESEHGRIFNAPDTTTGNEAIRARLPELRQAHELMQRAVAHDKRDLAVAQQAQAEAKAIADELNEVFDAAALAEARTQADAIKAQRAEIVKNADTLKSIKALVDAADAKTKQAAAAHADVAAWDALAEALAPDGIPGEILSEALGPINERLAQSAVDADWATVVIASDMAITAGGREYRLLSESEKWRTDAMLAEAVAHLSGTRLLVLDRFDVLDLHGRQELLSWLDTLADTGEIDTALIFGTLKALPGGLPETIQAHWLDAGTLGQLKEAA